MGRGGDGTNDTDEQERAAAAVTADAPPTELKRAPTKHPKSAEGGAWGCEWFDPPPSSKGEDDRWFNRHGEVVSLRNLYGTAGLYMCFTLWVIPLDLLGIFYWGISIKEAAVKVGRTQTGLYKALARIRDKLHTCIQTKMVEEGLA